MSDDWFDDLPDDAPRLRAAARARFDPPPPAEIERGREAELRVRHEALGQLTDFLLARIAGDEQIARAWLEQNPGEGQWYNFFDFEDGEGGAGSSITYETGSTESTFLTGTDPRLGNHIANWSPRRVLMECEAKRNRIRLALDNLDEAMQRRLLVQDALPYLPHGDFRDEWIA